MKKRNTIVKFRAGYIQEDGSVNTIDGKTGEKKTYASMSDLGHHSEIEISKMMAKK